MAAPVADLYACASGDIIAGGRYATRPYLVALGHSMIGQSELDPATTYVGMIDIAPHKWLNCLLGMPFDYPHCNIDKTIMDPPTGASGRNMVNGFYGQSGFTSGAINSEAAQIFVDQLVPLTSGRRVVAALMAEINDLNGGVAAATTWANYQSMMLKFSSVGWVTLLSKAPPSSGIGTDTKRDAFAAFNGLLTGPLSVMDFTSPYLDTGNVNGYQQPLAGYTTDGTHLNALGAYVLGISGSNALAGVYPRWKPLPTDVVCSQNPTLMTPGGTLGANATGVVPAGFTLNANGVGFSVVGSFGPDYYQMVFSYSGSVAPFLGTPQGLIADSFMASATPGSTLVQNICDVEVVEITNYQIQARNESGAGTGAVPPLNDYTEIGWMNNLKGRRINLHTEPHSVPAGATRTTTSFGCRPCYHAAAASLTVRIRWMGTKVAA